MAEYYPARVACRVCGITQRMLDYWVNREVVTPTKALSCERADARTGKRRATRSYYLFDFRALVEIQIVKHLRDAGVPLQRIRFAVERLRKRRGTAWSSTWLLTDGKKLYEQTDDPDVVESRTKGEHGQFVFAVIALAATAQAVDERRAEYEPFDHVRFKNGKLLDWQTVAR